MNEQNLNKKPVKMRKSSKILKSKQNSISQNTTVNTINATTTTTTSSTKNENSKKSSKNNRKGSLTKNLLPGHNSNNNNNNNSNSNNCNDKKMKHKINNEKSSTLPRNTKTSIQNNNNNNQQKSDNNQFKVPMLPPPPPPSSTVQQKFERSNSFFITRKLSKIFSSITGSKENLHLSSSRFSLNKKDNNTVSSNHNDGNDVDDDIDNEMPVYKFTRSRSMILLRRPKKSVIEQPKLEQLNEEIERNEKSPPRKSITNDSENNSILRNNDSNAKFDSRQNIKKRSSSIILSTIKRTFSNNSSTSISSTSGLTSVIISDKKQKDINPKWSASLHSLQEIDNMISYDNFSFIDYDKFGNYEKFLEQSLSYQDLTKSTMTGKSDKLSLSSMNTSYNHLEDNQDENGSIASSMTSAVISTVEGEGGEEERRGNGEGNDIVRRRYNKGRNRNNCLNTCERQHSINSNFNTNIDTNFDKPKNLYRQSIDSEKLRHMNDVQRESFHLSDSYEALMYLDNLKCNKQTTRYKKENNRIKKYKSFNSIGSFYTEISSNNKDNNYDVVDSSINSVSPGKLKSKSLTHLDLLDSMIACHQQQSPSATTTIPQKQKVSSSEYFSVYFCTEAGYQEEELIPATKGVTLSEALSNSLRRRNLSFSQITISDNNFQSCNADTGSPPYTSSLDENIDVENLAGKLLIVTEKDGSKKLGTLQKAASFGSRTRPPRLLSSASTEETTTEIEQRQIPGKQLKQRWSGLFGIKNPQQSQLCELLNNYTKNGVPQKKSSVNFDHPNFDMALQYLDNIHKSWRDFVNCDGMNDNDIKIQSAIWELVSTEVDYIHALQTVTDLFLACLEAIQDEKLLIDVDQNKLFSNIRDICDANLKFWTYYLYPMVANSILTKQQMCIDYFQPGFITFATTFSPYKKYCAEQSTCQYYCKELNRNNALFTAYLAWCESQKMCNRLRLADILVRPMQRLTKYSLLLSAIRKHIADENDSDIMDSMIHSVENFVYSVNTHLTTRQENERLKGIMARIESYDIVDSNNEQLDKLIKQYCTTLDLCSPMKGCITNQGRHLFMEGDLKLKDNIGKCDVHCFLLTDILLICKTIAKKGQGTLKVIRQPYLTDKLIVKHKDNTLYCVYLNDFQMVITAFTLQCTEAKCWNDAITKAKHIYTRLKQGSSNWDTYNLTKYGNLNNINNNNNSNCIKKSPLNSSIGSRVSSLNNSHNGSVELNDSRNISVEFEKTNSLSSDEGSNPPQKLKTLTSPHKLKTTFSNTLTVQPLNHLGQSLPNLNLHPNQASNNTLLVPGSTHSGNVLLSPSHRGISYPPPSPTRATLRRGFAFSSSIKNPPLLKTRNITSQSSINWLQTPATPQTSPQSGIQQQQSPTQQQQKQQHHSQQQQQQQQQQKLSQMSAGLQINESDV